MHNLRKFLFSLLISLTCVLFLNPETILAFQRSKQIQDNYAITLVDAIREFGGRRYIDPRPARLKAGPVKIHPTLTTQVEYDSNILRENFDGNDDVIFTLRPGVILELPVNRHQIAVGYEADIEIFTKASNQNDQNQSFFALTDFRFPSWYVNVLEQFTETSGRSGTTFTDRIPRYDNSIHPKIGYEWKRFTFEAGFRHFIRDFRRQIDDRLDFQQVEWTGVIFYDLFARLKALLEYQVAQIDYDDDFERNGTFHQVRVGLEGEIMPNLLVKMRPGLQFRNYEEDNQGSFNSWILDVLVEYQARPDLGFEFVFSREPAEATFDRANFYLRHHVAFGVEYAPWSQWSVYGRWGYSHHNYKESVTFGARSGFRRDNHFAGRYGIRYTANEWLQFDFSYEHLRRNSNFSTFDYTDHRVILSSNLAY